MTHASGTTRTDASGQRPTRARPGVVRLLSMGGVAIGGLLLVLLAQPALAAVDTVDVLRVLSFRDHNTRVVVIGVTLLGLAAGLIGVFALLRRRSLMADAVAHATLPGIAAAFMVGVALGGTGRSLPLLLAGATVAGLIGMGAVLAIRHSVRIRDDAALGIVLSVFFGVGVALLGIVQQMRGGNAAGLDRFILGQAAAISSADAWTILVAALLITILCVLLYKEMGVLCFDPAYAAALGCPVLVLDAVMMAMVVAVTVIGLQAVGLVLVVGLLIIPPAAARFWTDRLGPMLLAAAMVGGVSGFLGAVVSAIFPHTPTGPVIVLVCAFCFVVSLLIAPKRGVVAQVVRQMRVRWRTTRQHLLRDLYTLSPSTAIAIDDLLAGRSWSPLTLKLALRSAEREGLVIVDDGQVRLTGAGERQAARVVRNHRLWEQYLLRYADVAPGHVDRDADDIEHVLDPAIIEELERQLGASPAGGQPR